tara:strand:+ start:3661 stop:4443 length:783 start_codon:yes stop_codon:yes gene_type:complete
MSDGERLVKELLKHYDAESIQSISSIATMIDDMREDEPCVVSNVYETNITNKTHNNIYLNSFTNSSVIAQCTVCIKDECRSCSTKETDCPLHEECKSIEKFMEKNSLKYEDIKLFIDEKIYPQNVDIEQFEEFMKTYSLLEKNMFKIELVMTGGSGFGKVALYTALNHLNDDKDAIVFLSVWKKNKDFLEKYYEKIGFESYNTEFGKMRILSLKTLLSKLSTEQFPDSFVEIYNTLEPHKIFKCLVTSRRNMKRSRTSFN